ncbi:hypothetical protein D918_10025 [Trichuris suis]|nr:hypothetical protein D918_10025 [Trichuris suis]
MPAGYVRPPLRSASRVVVAGTVSCGSQTTLLGKQSETRRSARPLVARTPAVNDRSVYLVAPDRQRRSAVATGRRRHHASKRCARPPVASRPLAEQHNSNSDEDDEGAVVPDSSRSMCYDGLCQLLN